MIREPANLIQWSDGHVTVHGSGRREYAVFAPAGVLSLLRKYMRHVNECTGDTFVVTLLADTAFDAGERLLLQALDAELQQPERV